MPKEEILRYAKKIRPLVRGDKGDVLNPKNRNEPLWWAASPHSHIHGFTEDGTALKKAEGLTEFGRIITEHGIGEKYSLLEFISPRVDEAIKRCPKQWLDKVTAFEVQVVSEVVNCHVLTTIYYTGEVPEDIANLPVEW